MRKKHSDLLLNLSSLKMLDLLQQEGRMTVQSLADEVGLLTAPCWRRLRELEHSGVIRRYVALVDRSKVGLDSCMFTQVSLERHSESVVVEFERAVKETPEILECWVTTGDLDYMLKIFMPDVRAYDNFLHRFMFKVKGLRQIKTSVALREVKHETRPGLSQIGVS